MKRQSETLRLRLRVRRYAGTPIRRYLIYLRRHFIQTTQRIHCPWVSHPWEQLRDDIKQHVSAVADIQIASQMPLRRRDVLMEAAQFGRAGNRNDPWFLRQQPGQRNLTGRGLLLFRHLLQQVHQRLVGIERLRSEPRDDAAEIGLIECGVLADRARQKTFA